MKRKIELPELTEDEVDFLDRHLPSKVPEFITSFVSEFGSNDSALEKVLLAFLINDYTVRERCWNIILADASQFSMGFPYGVLVKDNQGYLQVELTTKETLAYESRYLFTTSEIKKIEANNPDFFRIMKISKREVKQDVEKEN